MGSRFASCSFLFYVLLVSQCTYTNSIREITEQSLKDVNKEAYDFQQTVMDDHLQRVQHEQDQHHHQSSHFDPSLHIFFNVNDLEVGKTIPIYFSKKGPSTSPPLLPREESNSIPFSLAHLPEILEFFSFTKESPQAKAMKYTLGECEIEPMEGETKFCATSLESLLDSARGIFSLETKLEILTTKHLSRHTETFQNYTILEVPKEMSTPKILACHTMPYPYLVYYCHGQVSDHKLFEVSLGGDNGERVDAVGVCHMDTSRWDPDHAAFRVLRTQPGRSPVCHFFPADNLIWVASPTMI